MQLPLAVLSSHILGKSCPHCSCHYPGNLHLALAFCWVRGVLQCCPEEHGPLWQSLARAYFTLFSFLGFFLTFQDLIEKVVILRKAVQLTQAVDPNAVGALLAEKMSQYASLLAAQGSIAAALTFLPANTNQVRGFQVFYSISLCVQTYFKQRPLHGIVSQQECHLKCTSRCDRCFPLSLRWPHWAGRSTWPPCSPSSSCPCSQWQPEG